MIDIPPPPTYCEAEANFAKEVMVKVNAGRVDLVKLTYASYSSDEHKRVLKKALVNFYQQEPLSPDEFSIKIYKECESQ